MNYINTYDVFAYTIHKIDVGNPLSRIEYYSTSIDLVVKWDGNRIIIKFNENGTFYIEYYNISSPLYLVYDNVNPYRIYDMIDYIYDRIDFTMNQTRPPTHI